jgi:hypothetical protein
LKRGPPDEGSARFASYGERRSSAFSDHPYESTIFRFGLTHKFRRRHLKSIRKSLDCRERWVSLAAFDASDEGSMHSGGVGELLL